MIRCFCACHQYPGTYPPPCGYCGHDDREGHMAGTYRDGWEPNPRCRDCGHPFRSEGSVVGGLDQILCVPCIGAALSRITD